MFKTRIGKFYLIICHVVIPAAFGYAAWLHFCDRLFLRWEYVVLIVLATLPFLLPLLSLYIRGVGKDGLLLHDPFQDRSKAPDVDRVASQSKDAVAKHEPGDAEARKKVERFADLSPKAKKVLRTLWRFQQEQFGENDQRRWGFRISSSAPDFSFFRIGATELLTLGFVGENDRGLVFLSSEGVEFCKRVRGELDGGGDYWQNFGPMDA